MQLQGAASIQTPFSAKTNLAFPPRSSTAFLKENWTAMTVFQNSIKLPNTLEARPINGNLKTSSQRYRRSSLG